MKQGMTEDEKEEEVGRRVRRVARVMAIAFTAWFVLQWLGGRFGLPVQLLPILDFMALFAFIWALFEIWNIVKIIRKE